MLVESRYPNCLSFSLLLQDGAHFFFFQFVILYCSMNLGKPWEMVKEGEIWQAAVRGFTESDTTG